MSQATNPKHIKNNVIHPKKIHSMDYVVGVDEFLTRIERISNQLDTYRDAQLFAAYLRRQHRIWGITIESLADKLNCPAVYLNLLLQSKVPAAKIDRFFLETVSDVFQEDPALIFSLVGRTFHASDENREETIQAKQQLSEYILNEVNSILFATIDERYADKNVQPDVYDKVINELQRIIARQRRDLRFIEGLLEGLENPNLTQVLTKDLNAITSDPAEQTIIYLKENLERIVEHLGGEVIVKTPPADKPRTDYKNPKKISSAS